MSKYQYAISGCAAGIIIGLISFTIYFKPLLESKKNGLESTFKSAISSGFIDKVNDAAIRNSNTAFKSMDYDSATEIIGTELAISLESIKIGNPKAPFHLTIAMLGACLSKSHGDTSRTELFEEAATKICNSLDYMKNCDLGELYLFIRKYSGSSQC